MLASPNTPSNLCRITEKVLLVLGAINDPLSNCLYNFPVVTAEDSATEIKEEFSVSNIEKQYKAEGI